MAYVITDLCNNCGLCVDECPIEAIEAGEHIFVIDETCCEFQECVAVCPEEAIVHESSVPENNTLEGQASERDAIESDPQAAAGGLSNA